MTTEIKSIYVNLPVRDLKKTRAFWTALGFGFNKQFSNERALCLILSEGSMYAMLLSHEMFKSFTNRSIADQNTTQVLLAIEVESKARVDQIVDTALSHGGSRYRESADHGWMYYDSFSDIDGHQWEIMFTDESKIPTENTQA